MTVLRDIFLQAWNMGLCDNKLEYIPEWWFESLSSSKPPLKKRTTSTTTKANDNKPPTTDLKTLRELEKIKLNQPERQKLPRFLSRRVLSGIVTQILKNLSASSLFIGIAICLYAGLRPAECRGLNYEDIIPFVDCPKQYYLSIYKQRDEFGNIVDRVKTTAGYRRIPIHCELQILLDIQIELTRSAYENYCTSRRMKVPVDETGAVDIKNLPICCDTDNVTKPCKGFAFRKFAKSLMAKIVADNKDLDGFKVEYATNLADLEDEGEDCFSLYVLRRNFRTCVQSATQMTVQEKDYCMGHAIYDKNKKFMNPNFNDERYLLDIHSKLNHWLVLEQLHESAYQMNITADAPAQTACNVGVQQISIDKDLIAKGGVLNLQVQANQPNRGIQIAMDSPVKQFKGKLVFQIKSIFQERNPVHKTTGINCDLTQLRMAGKFKHIFNLKPPKNTST